MEDEKTISAPNEELIWEQLATDFKLDPEPVEYNAVLEQSDRRILLDIFNNHEVSFRAESFTILTSYLYSRTNFRFALHKESFIDEIGKFCGMQDYILGYKEFDDRFVIKTNDEEKTAVLFADPAIRKMLLSLPELTFGTVEYTLENADGKAPFLELKIEKAINDLTVLRKTYRTFYRVLESMES